jgi:hypothetical protein
MRAYLVISGALFAIVALVHVLRLALGWPAEIAGWAVPMWVSWIAVPAAAALSIWAFRLLKTPAARATTQSRP